jgi:uncharacterized protein YraI
MTTLPKSILFGAAAVLCSAGMAAAYPATVTRDLHLRSGPSTAYRVVTTMPGGATVDVTGCRSNGWCHLRFRGLRGYASGNYLAGAPRTATTVEVLPPIYYAYADLYPPYWRSGYFHYWYGGRWHRVHRSRAWWHRHRHAIAAHRHHHRRAVQHRHHRREVRHERRQLHHAQRRRNHVRQRLHRSHKRVQHLRQRGANHRRVIHARQHQRHVRQRLRHTRRQVRHERRQVRHARHHR